MAAAIEHKSGSHATVERCTSNCGSCLQDITCSGLQDAALGAAIECARLRRWPQDAAGFDPAIETDFGNLRRRRYPKLQWASTPTTLCTGHRIIGVGTDFDEGAEGRVLDCESVAPSDARHCCFTDGSVVSVAVGDSWYERPRPAHVSMHNLASVS